MGFSWLKDSELEKFILNHARLAPGDKLQGRVIETRFNNKVLIDFGEFRALAQVEFSVKAGDDINVVVEARIPKLRLRLESSSAGNSVRKNMRKAVRELNTVSGNQWSYIRSHLNQFLGYENAADILFPASIKNTLETGIKTAKLHIHPEDSDSGESSGDRPVRLSLLLNGEGSPDMRVDFLLNRNESKLNITYFVRSDEVKGAVDPYLPKVEAELKPYFQFLVLHVIVSEKRVTQFDAEELEMKTGSRRVFDVKV